MKVSIVVPVYNAEEFLHESITSIINQTYKDIEIVCVDDGSIDQSFKILELYRKRDKRIVVLSQDNQGSAVARNTGFDSTSGEYVLFLDADDVFDKNLVYHVVLNAEETHADIIVFNYDVLNNKTKSKSSPVYKKPDTIISAVFSASDIPDSIFNSFGNNAWTKAFKRSFLDRTNLKFDFELRRAQDALFTNQALVLADSISYINEVLVSYREHDNNSWLTINKYPFNGLEFLEKMHSYLHETKIYDLYKSSFDRMFSRSAVYNLQMLLPHPEFADVFQRANQLFSEFDIDLAQNRDEDVLLVAYGDIVGFVQHHFKLLMESEQYYRKSFEDVQNSRSYKLARLFR